MRKDRGGREMGNYMCERECWQSAYTVDSLADAISVCRKGVNGQNLAATEAVAECLSHYALHPAPSIDREPEPDWCDMGKTEKILALVLRGTSDANIAFKDLCKLLKDLGFAERVRGDHFIYTKPQIEEILNIQPIGSLAKPYQVKQVRTVILKYKLGDLHED